MRDEYLDEGEGARVCQVHKIGRKSRFESQLYYVYVHHNSSGRGKYVLTYILLNNSIDFRDFRSTIPGFYGIRTNFDSTHKYQYFIRFS